jgi:hypothetical protein
MTTQRRSWLLSALALQGTALAAAPPPGTRISFMSCPIVRDTRSVPCWLSDYQGERYYLTIQSDVSATVQPPMLGHQVLVEGVVSDAARICGGIVLEPVRLSVMPERDANCNALLPADERYTVDFNPRPPGPSGGRLAFDPAPGTARGAPRPAPSGPQRIDVHFDFDRGVSFRHPADLVAVLQAARQTGAKRLTVTGWRGAHRLSDGTLLRESAATGRRRAEEVAGLLKGAGLDLPTEIATADGVAEADGIEDWRSRRVTVEMTP